MYSDVNNREGFRVSIREMIPESGQKTRSCHPTKNHEILIISHYYGIHKSGTYNFKDAMG